MTWRQCLAGLAADAFFGLGLQRRWPRGPLILMYHRFRADGGGSTGLARSAFVAQVAALKRRFELVTVSELARRLSDPDQAVASLAAITVDDGYRCVAEVALPVLREFGASATIYVPYRFIDANEWMWQDRAKYLLYRWTGGPLELVHAGRSLVFDTRTRDARYRSLERAYAHGRTLGLAGRQEFAERLSAACGIPLPGQPPADYAPLTWEQIRNAQADGIEFGSHTINHEMLTEVSAEVSQREIVVARTLLAERLDAPVLSFAYPDGGFTRREVEYVREAGYHNAVTTVPGRVLAGSDPWLLPRASAPAVRGRDIKRTMLFAR